MAGYRLDTTYEELKSSTSLIVRWYIWPRLDTTYEELKFKDHWAAYKAIKRIRYYL